MPRHSWVTGFHPPETSSRSASIVSAAPPGPATCTAETRGSPSVPVTAHPLRTSTPSARDASLAGPPSPTSMTAAISTPAAARTAAAP